MGQYLRGIWDRRPFMWHLARTELKARNYDTFLGQAWILIDPLLMAAVYYMLRTVVRPVSEADRNLFISHLIWSVFFFQYTAKSLKQGAQSILGNKQMVLNTAFPRGIFPVVAVLVALLDFLPTLAIYFVVHAVLGLPWGLAMLFYLPLMIGLLTLFNLGCALLYAPLTVFFRDTTSLLPYLTQVWTYVTPVLYTVQEIPPNLLVFLRFNPLYAFWAALEPIMVGRAPDPVYVFFAALWAVSFLVGGAILFLIREREFAIRF
jgi:teichoic acid transport system permease protein